MWERLLWNFLRVDLSSLPLCLHCVVSKLHHLQLAGRIKLQWNSYLASVGYFLVWTEYQDSVIVSFLLNWRFRQNNSWLRCWIVFFVMFVTLTALIEDFSLHWRFRQNKCGLGCWIEFFRTYISPNAFLGFVMLWFAIGGNISADLIDHWL